MQRFFKKFPFAVIVIVACLGVTAVAVAASSGDGSSVRSAQAIGGDSANTEANTLGDNGQGSGPDVLGERGSGGGNTAPTSASSPASGGGHGDSTLPFTGFVAIPLLVAGAFILLAGVGLRRRTVRTTT